MKTVLLNAMLVGAIAAQAPVFRTETRIVEIPIIATDARNSPVPDLTARDLRLLDNGVEQNILSLDRVRRLQSTGRQGARRYAGQPVGAEMVDHSSGYPQYAP
jgi:hypothetical protein